MDWNKFSKNTYKKIIIISINYIIQLEQTEWTAERTEWTNSQNELLI